MFKSIQVIGIFLLPFLISCSDSSGPDIDQTPPVVNLNLAVYPVGPQNPGAAAFYMDPRASTDNTSSFEELIMRWDYDNDGVWDTPFGAVESVIGYQPEVLPLHTWDVKCELRDIERNSTIKTESLVLPQWMPVPPDIVAGELVIRTNEFFHTGVDTVHAGEFLFITMRRTDWLNETGLNIVQRFYIDGDLHSESVQGTMFPSPRLYYDYWHPISEGISELGAHEIRVEVEIVEEFTETNSANNSSVKTLYVIE